MTIMAIDTSSAWCSVALLFDDRSFDLRHEELGSQSSQFLLPWIEDLLKKHNCDWKSIDAIAVSEGPGAFTGVRLGVGVAQGLSFANNKPLIPISSLDGLVFNQQFLKNPLFLNEGLIVVAIDARMDEVYWSKFEIFSNNPPKRASDILVSKIEDIDVSGINGFVGNALTAYPNRLHLDQSIVTLEASPNALGIALAASQLNNLSGLDAELCQPLYIRDKVAQTVQERSLNKTS